LILSHCFLPDYLSYWYLRVLFLFVYLKRDIHERVKRELKSADTQVLIKEAVATETREYLSSNNNALVKLLMAEIRASQDFRDTVIDTLKLNDSFREMLQKFTKNHQNETISVDPFEQRLVYRDDEGDSDTNHD
jgi:hypothetical protein